MATKTLTDYLLDERWWTSKQSPETVRGTYDLDLLMRVLEAKVKKIDDENNPPKIFSGQA
jgi:hypothetical protein